MENYKEYLEEAANAARKAGDVIRSNLGNINSHDCKTSHSDFVTEIDRKSEEIVTGHLSRCFPSHTIVGEESEWENPSLQGEPAHDNYTWYVDPLDGTTNFVFGIPMCTVSIALARGNEVLTGVVYDPFREEMFYATPGGGAFLNGERIEVDKSREQLSESLLVTGYPGNMHHRDHVHKVNLNKVIQDCSNLRAFGTAALEMAWVACGRLTGFWEPALRPWDIAAGKLIVEEAGGRVTDFYGKELQLESHVYIAASNGLIHDEFIQCLNTSKL